MTMPYGPPHEPEVPDAARKEPVDPARVEKLIGSMRFIPQPGPQVQAWTSPADQLGFGGQAGGGKSALMAGLATCGPHKQILLIRRQGTELVPLIDEITKIVGSDAGLNRSTGVWRLSDRTIRLGGVPNAGDEMKYQGAARDLLLVDECVHLLESQIRFLLGWQRSTDPNQRVRAVLATNPPTNSEGEWFIRWFAPWIDRNFPNPARPGELRYVAMLDGVETWVDGPAPFPHRGERITPISRTFIPARLADNVYLRNSSYVASLQALPEPLRTQLLHGDFGAGRSDDDYQCIPSAWVRAAMDRWTPRLDPGPVTSLGCDPSRGGDESTIAARHGWWFAPLVLVKPDAAGLITGGKLAHRVLDIAGDSAPVHIDIIGIGASTYDHLEAFIGNRAVPVNGAAGSEERDRSGHLAFVNERAAAWWRMRDLLDPSNPLSRQVALPRDERLFADLCAPHFDHTARGIRVEPKEDIKRRLGRSPDRGDAVVLAAMRTSTFIDHNRGHRITVRRSLRRPE